MKYVTAKEYGNRLTPKLGTRTVVYHCQKGRVKGAQKMPGRTGIWIIPVNAPDPRLQK